MPTKDYLAMCRVRNADSNFDWDDGRTDEIRDCVLRVHFYKGRLWRLIAFSCSADSHSLGDSGGWIKNVFQFEYDVIQKISRSKITSVFMRDDVVFESIIPKRPRVIQITLDDLRDDANDRLHDGDERVRNPITLELEELVD